MTTQLEQAARQALKVMGLIGADLVCEAAHHEKRDRHGIGEPCAIQARWHGAFTALRAALEQPAQDDVEQSSTQSKETFDQPVAWTSRDYLTGDVKVLWGREPSLGPLYTRPQAREPLTDEQIECIWDSHVVPVFGKNGINPIVFARAVERYHGIGENKGQMQ